MSFGIVKLLKQIEAKYGRSAFFQVRVCASLPSGDVCEITGNVWKMSGSFALGNDSYEFDGKGLFCNGDLLFNYNYSTDVMGVGESFSIYNSSGEFLFEDFTLCSNRIGERPCCLVHFERRPIGVQCRRSLQPR